MLAVLAAGDAFGRQPARDDRVLVVRLTDLAVVRFHGRNTETWETRVASAAEPGQVLVSSTVKDLVAGSGLVFEDAGEHELKGIPDIAYGHHERLNGRGYPRAVGASEIPVQTRMMTIVDVFDALTSKRPYKDAWTIEAAPAFLYAQRGRLFDPKCVEVLIRQRERLDDRAAVGLERRGVALVGTGALTVGRLPPRIRGRVHGLAPAFGRPEVSTVTAGRRIRVNGVCASRYRLPRTPQEHISGTVGVPCGQADR